MNTTNPSYLCIKTATASKTGKHAEGGIHYAVLKDSTSKQVFLTLTGNDGGGYFSREIVPFAKVEGCLSGSKVHQPLPAKTFRGAFVGKSSNNAGFLVAALCHEKLLSTAPDASHLHVVCGDWSAWQAAMLAQAGEPFALPEPKTKDMASADSGNSNASPQTASFEEPASPKKGKKARKDKSGNHEHPTSTMEGNYDAQPA